MKKIPFKNKKKIEKETNKKVSQKLITPNEKKVKLTPEEIEKELIKFDFTIKYGPFKGITRKERFERAKRFNLGVSDHILNLINSDKRFEWAYFEYLI